LPKTVDTSSPAVVAASSALQSISLSSPATAKSHLFQSTPKPPSAAAGPSSSLLLSPLTLLPAPLHSRTLPRAAAAGDAAEQFAPRTSAVDVGAAGLSDFDAPVLSSAAGSSTSESVAFHADFFLSTRQGEKLVRIFVRESLRLSMVPPPERTAELRRSLHALSQRIPSNLYLPIFPQLYSHWRLVGIAVEQYFPPHSFLILPSLSHAPRRRCCCFATNTRAPMLVVRTTPQPSAGFVFSRPPCVQVLEVESIISALPEPLSCRTPLL
jgi:hypothetical protein